MGDGLTKINATRLPSRESKDYQVRGMLQKLTHVTDPLDHQPRTNASMPPRECLNNSTSLWASPSQRRSQSVTSLRERVSGGSAAGAIMCAPGVAAPTAAIPVGP